MQSQTNWFLRHKFLSALIVLIALLVLLVSAKSMIATYYLRDFFKQHASDIAIEDLTVRIYDSDFQIRGLKTRHANGQQLNIAELYVDWQFEGLFDNHITVNKIQIDGLQLDVQSNEFVPVQIGPLLLAKFTDSENPAESAEPGEPWSMEIQDIAITDLSVCLDDVSLLYEELGLPLVANQERLGVCLTTESIAIDGDITLDKNQEISYEEDVLIQNLALKTSKDESLLRLEELSLDDLSLSTEQLGISNTELTSFALLAESNEADHADLGVNLDKLEINNLQVGLKTTGNSLDDLTIDNIILRAEAADNQLRTLTNINELSLTGFDMQAEVINLDSATLSGIQLLENYLHQNQTTNYLTELSGLSVTDINTSPSELTVSDIQLSGLDSLIIFDDNGLNLANWLPVSTAEPSSEEIPASEPMSVTVDNFQLEPANLRILESVTGEQYEHQLSDISLSLQNLAIGGRADSEPTLINYQANLSDNGTLSGEGTLNLSSEAPDISIKGALSALNLVDVSHLAARHIGYRVDRGQLNLDYDVQIKAQQIDAGLKALLEKFALATLEENEKSPLNEDLGLPLPAALNLLRDSDDNIELDLPITGDVNSPDFSVGSIVSTVMVKAIKNAVILNYSPLGMLTMASGILDLATALRFDPIVFETRSTALTPESDEQLSKIIKLLNEKPKVKMVICGVATERDYPEQQPVAITGEQTDLNGQTTPVIEPILDPLELIELAKQRQEIVISHIVETGKIDKSRLIGCNVKVAKKKDAQPVVTISI